MPITFNFNPAALTVVQSGDVCKIYDGYPLSAAELAGEAYNLLSSQSVGADMLVSFDPGGRESVALVLERGGSIFARSNDIDLSGVADGDEVECFISQFAQTQDESELQTYVPAVPFTEDNITVQSVQLDVLSDELRLTGDAFYDGWWFFDATIEFEYKFALEPAERVMWTTDDDDAYLVVVTQDLDVKGANVLQDILLAFAKGGIERRLVERLQGDLNDAIRDGVAVLSGVEATVETVSVGAGELEANLNVWGLESLCALSLSAPASASRPSEAPAGRLQPPDLEPFRKTREEIVRPSAKGVKYLALLERHQVELSRLLFTNRRFARRARRAVQAILEGHARGPITTLDATTVERIHDLMSEASAHGSPRLREAIEEVKAELGEPRRLDIRRFLQ